MNLISDPKLLDWVEDFIDKHNLLGERTKVLVGLSGGPDSMLLSHVCDALVERGRIEAVRFIHIDHGVRDESGAQAFVLSQWCKDWNWNFKIIKLTGPVPKSNLEAQLRASRRELLLSELMGDEVLFLGHHIDDSFEWYLRQSVNSSKGEFAQGIPLVNGFIRRPFHCLSRDQIENFIRLFKIPILTDESNEDLRLQRNALRKTVKKPLLRLFPKGLAHYVERSNRWARDQKKVSMDKDSNKFMRFILGKGVVCLVKEGGSWREREDDILRGIKELSEKGRGSLRENLNKLYESIESSGRPGPMAFSGGVKIRMYGDTLLLYNSHGEKELKDFSCKWAFRIKASDIPCGSFREVYRALEGLGGLPFVLYRYEDFGLKGLKVDPLFSDLIEEASLMGLSLRPIEQLKRHSRKNSNRNSQDCEVLVLTR